jgi:hypothetical protein
VDFRGVGFYLTFFVSDVANLGHFPLHFSEICKGFVNLVYFFKVPAFCFIDSLYMFFVSISLISARIFIISLLLFVLGFACSCFSKS